MIIIEGASQTSAVQLGGTRITELTPEQQAECDRVYHEAIAIGRTTKPIDQTETERVITELYKLMGKEKPTFYLCDSPAGCLRKYKELTGCTEEEAIKQRQYFFEGNHWACVWVWAKFAQWIGVTYTDEQTKLLDLWYSQWRNAHWWLAYDTVVLLSQRPTVCEVDEAGRLHNENGPAIGYADGYGVWSIHGVRVPKKVIEAPSTLTAKEIHGETNAEVRRIMLNRFGTAKFIEQLGAKPVHEDDFGTLFRVDIPDDEPLEMVRVIDATPEPITSKLEDGYVLRPDRTNNVGVGYFLPDTLDTWWVKERGDKGQTVGGPFYTASGAVEFADGVQSTGQQVEVTHTPASKGGPVVSPHGIDSDTGLPLRVFKVYWLRVEPGSKTAQEAVASTWRYRDSGERVFKSGEEYRPAVET